jgi:nucleoside-diphosphate-sugar epimerase
VDPIGPRACYDEGKRVGEAAVSVAVAHRGLDARVVRFFYCYDPRMSNADGRLIAAVNV